MKHLAALNFEGRAHRHTKSAPDTPLTSALMAGKSPSHAEGKAGSFLLTGRAALLWAGLAPSGPASWYQPSQDGKERGVGIVALVSQLTYIVPVVVLANSDLEHGQISCRILYEGT